MKCTHDFNPEHRDGRYFRFGVREFGMSAICNGLYGMVPYMVLSERLCRLGLV